MYRLRRPPTPNAPDREDVIAASVLRVPPLLMLREPDAAPQAFIVQNPQRSAVDKRAAGKGISPSESQPAAPNFVSPPVPEKTPLNLERCIVSITAPPVPNTPERAEVTGIRVLSVPLLSVPPLLKFQGP